MRSIRGLWAVLNSRALNDRPYSAFYTFRAAFIWNSWREFMTFTRHYHLNNLVRGKRNVEKTTKRPKRKHRKRQRN